MSGVDQQLNGPITSIEKLQESKHILYVYKQISSGVESGLEPSNASGYLKVGLKNLFFYVSFSFSEIDKVLLFLWGVSLLIKTPFTLYYFLAMMNLVYQYMYTRCFFTLISLIYIMFWYGYYFHL